MEDSYRGKYLKYKAKYLSLRGGERFPATNELVATGIKRDDQNPDVVLLTGYVQAGERGGWVRYKGTVTNFRGLPPMEQYISSEGLLVVRENEVSWWIIETTLGPDVEAHEVGDGVNLLNLYSAFLPDAVYSAVIGMATVRL